MVRSIAKGLLVVTLLLAALAAGAGWYLFGVPGKSFRGPRPPATSAETALADRLMAHVSTIAREPHNVAHPRALEAAAGYIEAELRKLGYGVRSRPFLADGVAVRNIEVVIDPAEQPPRATLVVGAHYDSCCRSPGADDNATGSAAVIELAGLLRDLRPNRVRLRLVLFVNEEMPWFGTDQMGSRRYARELLAAGEPVVAMLSLETIGFYSDRPGSQRYPQPLSWFYPATADFVAFVGTPSARALVHEAIGDFRRQASFPSEGGVAPDIVEGIAWSDHAPFAELGIPAIMVTDTALFRNPHYHRPSDTPETIDRLALARVTLGLESMLRAMVARRGGP